MRGRTWKSYKRSKLISIQIFHLGRSEHGGKRKSMRKAKIHKKVPICLSNIEAGAGIETLISSLSAHILSYFPFLYGNTKDGNWFSGVRAIPIGVACITDKKKAAAALCLIYIIVVSRPFQPDKRIMRKILLKKIYYSWSFLTLHDNSSCGSPVMWTRTEV